MILQNCRQTRAPMIRRDRPGCFVASKIPYPHPIQLFDATHSRACHDERSKHEKLSGHSSEMSFKATIAPSV